MSTSLFVFYFVTVVCIARVTAQETVRNEVIQVDFNSGSESLMHYTLLGSKATLSKPPPLFEIDGNPVECKIADLAIHQAPEVLDNGVTQYAFRGRLQLISDLELTIHLQLSSDNAVLRCKYVLSGTGEHHLTKSSGADNITYSSVTTSDADYVKEIQFANYDEKIHSYMLKEQVIDERYFTNAGSVMRPMVTWTTPETSFLMAYEHGSQHGNEFLHFELSENGRIDITAVKGNYLDQQPISGSSEYETLWFEISGVPGDEAALAREYRTFVLKYLTRKLESRIPYIFYNTWGRQERLAWAGAPYLQSMNLQQTLAEIERAHEMGVDVFVIDTGWYRETAGHRPPGAV